MRGQQHAREAAPCRAGVLNVVHGTHDVVTRICDHPSIKAVSIVGSNAAGKHVYTRACGNGKRAQANTGAKNHAVIMPDADVDSTVKALTGAAFGAAGQRCMAISAAVFVGGFERWREPLRQHAQHLKVFIAAAVVLACACMACESHSPARMTRAVRVSCSVACLRWPLHSVIHRREEGVVRVMVSGALLSGWLRL